MNLPPEAIMREMAKLAMEQATESFAKFAEQFAANPQMAKVNGQQALTAFAVAIRSTNAKVWPTDARDLS